MQVRRICRSCKRVFVGSQGTLDWIKHQGACAVQIAKRDEKACKAREKKERKR